jgi:hypothetical protein
VDAASRWHETFAGSHYTQRLRGPSGIVVCLCGRCRGSRMALALPRFCWSPIARVWTLFGVEIRDAISIEPGGCLAPPYSDTSRRPCTALLTWTTNLANPRVLRRFSELAWRAGAAGANASKTQRRSAADGADARRLAAGRHRRPNRKRSLAALLRHPRSIRVHLRHLLLIRHYVANATKDRHPRESGDPCGIGPRFRGDDGVVGDACEQCGVCYIVPC